jgi:hypothetical protein
MMLGLDVYDVAELVYDESSVAVVFTVGVPNNDATSKIIVAMVVILYIIVV